MEAFAPRLQAIADLVTIPFFFIGIGTVVWMSAIWTAEAIEGGHTTGTIWDPPIWPMRLLLTVGAFLLLLQGVVKLIRDFGQARTGRGTS